MSNSKTPLPDYKNINRKSWNSKVEIHINSDFYDNDNFIKGKSSLNDIELSLLGEIQGKSILHLQCHFGQDTISLTRLGANATGVDISDVAIDRARALAIQTSSQAKFICSDIYDLPQHLDDKFDIVFTSYGTIGWLPDLDQWAGIVSHFLKPGGTFLIVEFHPVVWMFDDNFEKIAYRYFNSGPIIEAYSGSYAAKDAPIHQEYVMWNHGLGEVVNSLIQKGLTIDYLNEYDYSPYNCFNKTIKIAQNKYRIQHLDNMIPMVYAVKARKA